MLHHASWPAVVGPQRLEETVIRHPRWAEALTRSSTRARRLSAVALASLLVAATLVVAPRLATPPFEVAGCSRADLKGQSVARVWDEQVLDLIRQVVPAPTVHARNLFHLSAAMWDAWAAYDATADGYFVTEKGRASDVVA